MKRIVRTILIGAAAGLCLATAASAQETRTAPIGGPGGWPFKLDCGEDGAIVGFNARTGAFVNGVQLICRKLQRNELTGPVFNVGAAGGEGGTPVQQLCPAGSMVTGLGGSWNARSYNLPGVQIFERANYVHELTMRCQRWNEAANRFDTTATLVARGRQPGSETRLPTDPSGWCPPNAIGSGIEGRAGVYLDSVGLVCDPARIRPPRVETFNCPANVRATADVVGDDGKWRPLGGPALKLWRATIEGDTMICAYVTANDRGDRIPDHWRMALKLPENARCTVDNARPDQVRCRRWGGPGPR